MRLDEITVSLEVRRVPASELPGAQTVEPVLTDAQRERMAGMFRRIADGFDSAAFAYSVAVGAGRALLEPEPVEQPAEQPAGTRTWRFASGSTVSFNGGAPVPIQGGEMRARFGCGCLWCQAAATGTPPPQPTDDDARTALEGQILAYATPAEVAAVRQRLRAGKLYNTYGECVIGIIAELRGQTYHSVQLGEPAYALLRVPDFESWLSQIPRGATPESNAAAATLDAWLTDWLTRQGAEEVQPAEPPALPARPTLQQILAALRAEQGALVAYTFHPERGLVRRE